MFDTIFVKTQVRLHHSPKQIANSISACAVAASSDRLISNNPRQWEGGWVSTSDKSKICGAIDL